MTNASTKILAHLHRNRVQYVGLLVFIDQVIKHNMNNVVFNTGASFGILKGYTNSLIIFSLLIIGLFAYLSYRTQDDLLLWSYASIIGGAASNLIDRLMLGFVIDYIQLPFFPAFNLGDAMITAGAVLFMGHAFLHRKKKN